MAWTTATPIGAYYYILQNLLIGGARPAADKQEPVTELDGGDNDQDAGEGHALIDLGRGADGRWVKVPGPAQRNGHFRERLEFGCARPLSEIGKARPTA